MGEGPGDPHLHFGWLGHEHTLEDLGEVPQIEGVVGLGWSGQQLGGDGRVYPDGSFHEGLRQVHDVGGPSCGGQESGRGHTDGSAPVQQVLQVLTGLP